MSHADIVLADLDNIVRGGPLPTVMQIEGDWERPALGTPRVAPPTPTKHTVWVTTHRGVEVRFQFFALPHTARDEAGIEARGRYPGQVRSFIVRPA